MERRAFFRTALVASSVVGVEAARATSAGATFFWWCDLAPPSLCVVGTTVNTVKLNVTAGYRGAAAGFTVQWMKKSDYVANCNRWVSSGDPRLYYATFNASNCYAKYSLDPCETACVEIGNLPTDGSVCTNFPCPLLANTQYIFRAFAHGYGFYCKSGFSCDVCAMTGVIPPPPPT